MSGQQQGGKGGGGQSPQFGSPPGAQFGMNPMMPFGGFGGGGYNGGGINPPQTGGPMNAGGNVARPKPLAAPADPNATNTYALMQGMQGLPGMQGMQSYMQGGQQGAQGGNTGFVNPADNPWSMSSATKPGPNYQFNQELNKWVLPGGYGPSPYGETNGYGAPMNISQMNGANGVLSQNYPQYFGATNPFGTYGGQNGAGNALQDMYSQLGQQFGPYGMSAMNKPGSRY